MKCVRTRVVLVTPSWPHQSVVQSIRRTLVLTRSSHKNTKTFLHSTPAQALEYSWCRCSLQFRLFGRQSIGVIRLVFCQQKLATDRVRHSHELTKLQSRWIFTGKGELLV